MVANKKMSEYFKTHTLKIRKQFHNELIKSLKKNED